MSAHAAKTPGAVFHEEAQVVLRLQLFNGNDRNVIRARAANDRLHTKLQMARHFEHITHDRARSRTSTRTFTEEHGLAYGIADHVDRVVNAIDLRKLMIERNHSGVNTHIDTVIGAMSMRQRASQHSPWCPPWLGRPAKCGGCLRYRRRP